MYTLFGEGFNYLSLVAIDGTRGEAEIVMSYSDDIGEVESFREWFDNTPELAQQLTDFTGLDFDDKLIGLLDVIAQKIPGVMGYYSTGGENGMIYFGDEHFVDNDINQDSCYTAAAKFSKDYMSLEEFEVGEESLAVVDQMWTHLENHEAFILLDDVLSIYAPLLEDELLDVLTI